MTHEERMEYDALLRELLKAREGEAAALDSAVKFAEQAANPPNPRAIKAAGRQAALNRLVAIAREIEKRDGLRYGTGMTRAIKENPALYALYDTL